jgi:hypothetical protein
VHLDMFFFFPIPVSSIFFPSLCFPFVFHERSPIDFFFVGIVVVVGFVETQQRSMVSASWVLPFIAPLLHLALLRSSKSVIPTSIVLRRMFLYLLILIFRTVVLFALPNSYERHDGNCW